jgi:hypothetical protein
MAKYRVADKIKQRVNPCTLEIPKLFLFTKMDYFKMKMDVFFAP